MMSNWTESKIDLDNTREESGKEYDTRGLGVPSNSLSDYEYLAAEITTGNSPDMMVEIYDTCRDPRKNFVSFVISPQSARVLAQALLLHANAIETEKAAKILKDWQKEAHE